MFIYSDVVETQICLNYNCLQLSKEFSSKFSFALNFSFNSVTVESQHIQHVSFTFKWKYMDHGFEDSYVGVANFRNVNVYFWIKQHTLCIDFLRILDFSGLL